MVRSWVVASAPMQITSNARRVDEHIVAASKRHRRSRTMSGLPSTRPPSAPSAATQTASSLLVVADEHFSLARWRPALAAYAGVSAAVPTHLRARLRIGDTLLNLAQQEASLEVYRALAAIASRAGQPLVALVALKMVQLLDPAAEDVVGVVTDRYAAGNPRLAALFAGPAVVEAGSEAASMLDADSAALVDDATRVACHGQDDMSEATALPLVPLLSYLDEDAFTSVLSSVRLRRFSDEEVVVRQGERSESFFLVADGEVSVERGRDDVEGRVVLARLRRGAVFGELALIADEPRQASVVAIGDVDVLEVRRADLVVAAAHHDGVSQALRQFTRERFLRNLTATHPFFQLLDKGDRHRIMEVTNVLTFKAGDVLIEEGRRGPGLFVLLGGQATVKKKIARGDDVEYIHLATLRASDLCGEMSMLADEPTNATVTCSDDLEALFLSRDAFQSVTAQHPELLLYLANLTDERLRHNRALVGRALLEDDEHVMI